MLKALFRTKYSKGSSLVEAILSAALLGLLMTTLVGAYLYGEEATMLAGSRARAVLMGAGGMDAVRNIRDDSFANLNAGTFGLATSSNQWIFSGAQDLWGIFTRQTTVATVDACRKTATVDTAWQQNAQRTGTFSATTRLTDWREPKRTGMLVYGDGGTTSDAIKYQLLDQCAGTWSTAAATADVDGATTNRALRSMRLFVSATRNEKIFISRHYNGTTQYIYGQVWNGTTSTWGNVQLLANWNTTTLLDVQNFDGTYLANGDFMVVYADNTTTPKMRTWNGTAWSGQVSMRALSAIPSAVVISARPGTNEVMAAIFNQAQDTQTQYFNGGAYALASWTLHATHSTSAPVGRRTVDFVWSAFDTTKGGLVFNNNQRRVLIKVWTANGTGGGAWSGSASTGLQTGTPSALAVVARPGAAGFVACAKDDSGTPDIVCYDSSFTPAWTNPTNPTMSAGTDAGIQRSFDIAFENISGNPALGVYSDTTAIPKLKKYNPTTTTWDAAATNLSTVTVGLETVRTREHPLRDNIMILLANTNQDLFSVVWDGANDTVYTSPTGQAFAAHGTAGSADEDFWYDFVWDSQ